MPIYTFVMNAVAAALLIAGGLLCAGQYGWLHGFSFSAHKDDKAYARYLGKSVMGLGVILVASGFVCMQVGTIPAVIVLVVGVIAAFVAISKGASKYY